MAVPAGLRASRLLCEARRKPQRVGWFRAFGRRPSADSAARVVAENIRRFRYGEPLSNLFDPKAGTERTGDFPAYPFSRRQWRSGPELLGESQPIPHLLHQAGGSSPVCSTPQNGRISANV